MNSALVTPLNCSWCAAAAAPQARIQTQPAGHLNTASAFRTILRQDGVRGLFAGAASPLVALTILNTLNFSGYARAREALGVPPSSSGASTPQRRTSSPCLPRAALRRPPRAHHTPAQRLSRSAWSFTPRIAP